jgi:hypothetical protein
VTVGLGLRGYLVRGSIATDEDERKTVSSLFADINVKDSMELIEVLDQEERAIVDPALRFDDLRVHHYCSYSC